MVEAYVNRVATAVPQHEVHEFFLGYARGQLAGKPREERLFRRMADRAGIERRYCCFRPALGPEADSIDHDGLFRRGAFPGTAARMALYERHAPVLAAQAVEALDLGDRAASISHLIVTSCTGFFAPGIDLAIQRRCGLSAAVERTIIGFMGCYAAVNALKLARHIVRSAAGARVLVVNIELCTLHLRETDDIERLLTFCLWGDGCAAALVSSEPVGLRLDGFHAMLAPDTEALMTWHVGDQGFEMVLSGQVPSAVQGALRAGRAEMLGQRSAPEIGMWAVHPGGRSVLDGVEAALELDQARLRPAREVLRCFGNMSSATIMFVLAALLAEPASPSASSSAGCGMAFGPGLVAETFTFTRMDRAA
jgi:predicted naringenin-chalcone synthase